MRKLLLSAILGLLIGFTVSVQGQQRTVISHGTSLPASCAVGDLFFLTVAPIGLHEATASGPCTWKVLSPASGSTNSVQYKASNGTLSGDSTFMWDAAAQELLMQHTLIDGTSGSVPLSVNVFTPSTGSFGSHWNFKGFLDYTSSGTLNYYWGVDLPTYNSSTGTINNVRSAETYVENLSTGTIGTVTGVKARVYNDSTGTITEFDAFDTDTDGVGNYGEVGTFGTYVTFRARTPVGPFTSLYGMKLEDQAGITASTNRAIDYGGGKFIVGSDGSVVSLSTITGTYLLPTTSYKSVDGTVGATVTTCTAFKNGLCVSGS